jgi:hypothetical protein
MFHSGRDIRRNVHHGGVCVSVSHGYQSMVRDAQRDVIPIAVVGPDNVMPFFCRLVTKYALRLGPHAGPTKA